ncbi:MAG: hypothetical protein IJW46_04865 [Clostridia bacterium]|nr:hypothetical protein [Clostridia bacterium]
MKKLAYLLWILSYCLIGFDLVYFNVIDPVYEGVLGGVLAACAIGCLFFGIALLVYSERRKGMKAPDRLEKCLAVIAVFPLALLAFLPLCVFLSVYYPILSYRNRMRVKARVLLDKGFVLTKKGRGKKKRYYLRCGNTVLRIVRYRSYEISTDGGVHFEPLASSSFLTEEERQEVCRITARFQACDPRDAEEYEPTEPLLSLVAAHI